MNNTLIIVSVIVVAALIAFMVYSNQQKQAAIAKTNADALLFAQLGKSTAPPAGLLQSLVGGLAGGLSSLVFGAKPSAPSSTAPSSFQPDFLPPLI